MNNVVEQFTVAICFLGTCFCITPPISAQKAVENIESLIHQLQDISEGDIGYMPTRSGSGFLPLGTSDSGMMLLGQKRPESSSTMRQLIEFGAEAIPQLVDHLDDDRASGIRLEFSGGFGGMFLSNEYDFNSNSSEGKPANVNGDFLGGDNDIESHTVTVGDLCFVALGQIVNRNFNAVRYQPTAIIVVNSPVRNEDLRDATKAEWSDIDEMEHKASLILDFQHADHERRRTGAYLRLSFYYPEEVEALVLEELAKPTFDVFEISDFCRDTLYKIDNEVERQRRYDEFIRKHGDVFSIGIMNQLFGDLDRLEAHERGATSPPLTAFDTQPRELLIQLFDFAGRCEEFGSTEGSVRVRISKGTFDRHVDTRHKPKNWTRRKTDFSQVSR